MRRQALSALLAVLVLTGLAGLVYPLLVTGLAALLFPQRASGSLIVEDGRAAGSALIGQSFSAPGYFWGRPSATAPFPCNAALSGASNLGPANPELAKQVKARIEALRAADPGNSAPVPVDLVTASASGLDPHVSPAAAFYQVPRVARVRGLSRETVRDLVRRHVRERQWGILGEPVVNVLELNLDLEKMAASPKAKSGDADRATGR